MKNWKKCNFHLFPLLSSSQMKRIDPLRKKIRKDTHLQKKANVKAIEKVFNVNKSVFGLNLS